MYILQQKWMKKGIGRCVLGSYEQAGTTFSPVYRSWALQYTALQTYIQTDGWHDGVNSRPHCGVITRLYQKLNFIRLALPLVRSAKNCRKFYLLIGPIFNFGKYGFHAAGCSTLKIVHFDFQQLAYTSVLNALGEHVDNFVVGGLWFCYID